MFKRFSLVQAVAAAGFVVALAAPPQAFAAYMAERTPRATVRLDDVDANSEDGARVLLRRIERADAVCGESLARRYITLRGDFRRCRERTIASTIERIGAARLHAEFVARYGQT